MRRVIEGEGALGAQQRPAVLLQRSIPSTQGITNIIQNIGKTKNAGWEVQLTTVNLDRAGVKWSSLFNVTVNHNKIVDLYGDGKDDLANQWFIGKPINLREFLETVRKTLEGRSP